MSRRPRTDLNNTDIGHAGEWLDDILQARLASADPPLIMSDALSSNHTTNKPIIKTLCNAHARRQFVDVFNHFPEEVGWVLEQYKCIWLHEDQTREQQMTPEQRRDYHRAQSQKCGVLQNRHRRARGRHHHQPDCDLCASRY